MSKANRKGYTTVMARDAAGNIKHVVVRKGSRLHKMYLSKNKVAMRPHKQAFREFKTSLKQAKKQFKPEERAKINWSEAQQP